MVLQVLKPTPSEDKLDKLLKVVNIVDRVYGIKTNSDKVEMYKAQTQKEKALARKYDADAARKPQPKTGSLTDAAKARQMDFDLSRMKRISDGGALNEGDMFHFTEKHGGSFSPNREKGSMGPFAGPGGTTLYYSPTKETLLFSEKATTQTREQKLKEQEAFKKRQDALKTRAERITEEKTRGAVKGKIEAETGEILSKKYLNVGKTEKVMAEAGEIDYLKEARRQDLLAKAAASRAKAKAEKSGKNLKASQFVAANYSIRMEQAEKDLQAAIEDGFDPTKFTNAMSVEYSPEILKGQGAKRFAQAKRNFTLATLRRESGAAINRSEHIDANKQYFPVAGDSAKVIAQKARNRLIVMSAFKTEAGQAYNLTKIQMMETTQQRREQKKKETKTGGSRLQQLQRQRDKILKGK